MTIYSSRSQFVLPEIDVIQRGPLVQWGVYAAYGKRALDVVLVIAAAPFWVPLVGLMAVVVALSGGKPFYKQRRLGRNGDVFTLWKLRTMVPGAEALLEAHLAANPAKRDEWERNQKISDDPRITRLGTILRNTCLDELPQLWNVLKGDMSLIGPRPMLPEQRPLYHGRSYFALRPGVTGLWQVSGGSRLPFTTRSEHDDRYAQGLSFIGDLRILLTTVVVVLRCTGR
jgi:exopolysaccharide production protein ExoY